MGVSVRHLTIQHFAVLNDALEGCKNIEGLRLGFVGAEDFVQGNRWVLFLRVSAMIPIFFVCLLFVLCTCVILAVCRPSRSPI